MWSSFCRRNRLDILTKERKKETKEEHRLEKRAIKKDLENVQEDIQNMQEYIQENIRNIQDTQRQIINLIQQSAPLHNTSPLLRVSEANEVPISSDIWVDLSTLNRL